MFQNENDGWNLLASPHCLKFAGWKALNKMFLPRNEATFPWEISAGNKEKERSVRKKLWIDTGKRYYKHTYKLDVFIPNLRSMFSIFKFWHVYAKPCKNTLRTLKTITAFHVLEMFKFVF